MLILTNIICIECIVKVKNLETTLTIFSLITSTIKKYHRLYNLFIVKNR